MIHRYLKGYLSKACTAEKDPSILWRVENELRVGERIYIYSTVSSLESSLSFNVWNDRAACSHNSAFYPGASTHTFWNPETLGRQRWGICPHLLSAVRQWTPQIPEHRASGLRYHTTRTIYGNQGLWDNLGNAFKRLWPKQTGTLTKGRWVERCSYFGIRSLWCPLWSHCVLGSRPGALVPRESYTWSDGSTESWCPGTATPGARNHGSPPLSSSIHPPPQHLEQLLQKQQLQVSSVISFYGSHPGSGSLL